MIIYNILAANTELVDIDPKETLNEIEKLLPKVIEFGKLFLFAIIVYFIGRKLTKWLIKIMEKSIQRSNMDQSVSGFFLAVVKVILHAVLIIMIVAMLGFDTTSLVALVGSAGLTIGLALQGSLSNFAGGVLILAMKPFRVGDYIITSTYEGVVSSIDLFYTRLVTVDNRMVVLPNGTLSNSNIINATNEPIRRLDLTVSIGYTESVEKVREILTHVAQNEELVKKDFDINIFVNSFDQSSLTLGIRVWVDTENYWVLKCSMLERMKEAFDRNHITIPYNKLDVKIIDSK